QIATLGRGARPRRRRRGDRRAALPFASYAQVSYEALGGIVDLAISPSHAQLIREGLLAFQVQSSVWVAQPNEQSALQPSPTRIVLKENPLTAQTDRRSIYLSEGEKSEFQISVKNRGKPAPAANVLIVKYNPPDALRPPVDAIPANLPQVVNVLNGHGTVITV